MCRADLMFHRRQACRLNSTHDVVARRQSPVSHCCLFSNRRKQLDGFTHFHTYPVPQGLI
ncbi:hypothetical protein FMEAI12_7030003 [Parafrankia sp. Ea1.12]|nr:hypothetical protein FMEAI12_7030003 [Parafrankia sp. Ea1.12]